MIVDIARENSTIIIWSVQIGWLVVGLCSKLILEPLLVADHYLLAFGLQETDERLDNLESCATEWHKN